jgi:hypothetical protein
MKGSTSSEEKATFGWFDLSPLFGCRKKMRDRDGNEEMGGSCDCSRNGVRQLALEY